MKIDKKNIKIVKIVKIVIFVKTEWNVVSVTILTFLGSIALGVTPF